MTHLDNANFSNGQEFDDLTVINGIKERREQQFREWCQVRTYRDLAKLSREEIKIAFSEHGGRISDKDIKNILDRAKELATDSREIIPHKVGNSEVEIVTSTIPSSNSSDWEPYAVFFIEFQRREEERKINKRILARQTQVERGTWQDEDPDIEWEELNIDQLYSWMLDKAGEEVNKFGEFVQLFATKEQPLDKPPVAVEITSVQISQIDNSLTYRSSEEDIFALENFTVSKDIPIGLGLSFRISGDTVDEINGNGFDYRVRWFAYNQSSGNFSHLGDTTLHTLEENKLEDKVNLGDITLPHGTYALRALVELQIQPLVSGHIELSPFKVV